VPGNYVGHVRLLPGEVPGPRGSPLSDQPLRTDAGPLGRSLCGRISPCESPRYNHLRKAAASVRYALCASTFIDPIVEERLPAATNGVSGSMESLYLDERPQGAPVPAPPGYCA
jgi:hypothetical protein